MKFNICSFTAPVLALLLSLTTPLAGSAGTYKHVEISGTFQDWNDVPVVATMAQGSSAVGFDLKDIRVANDESNIFFLVELWPTSTSIDFDNYPNQLFFDTDTNAATGHGTLGLGSDVCLQFGSGWGDLFLQSALTWDVADLSGFNFAEAPTGNLTNYAFEVRMSRWALGTNGLPVFTQNTINIGYASLTSSYVQQDALGPFTYTMAAPAPPPNTYAQININGPTNDWANIPVACTNPPGNSLLGFDLSALYVANDESNLYFLVTLWPSSTDNNFSDPNISGLQLLLDTDNDAATGNNWAFNPTVPSLGSEACVEFGTGFGDAFQLLPNGWQGIWATNGLNFAEAPTGVLGNYAFQFQMSRSTKYADGTSVFTNNVIGLGLKVKSNNYSSDESVIGPVAYTFASGNTVVTPPTLSILRSGANLQLTWSGGGMLQTCTDLRAGNWVAVSGAASGVLIPATNAASFFRVQQ